MSLVLVAVLQLSLGGKTHSASPAPSPAHSASPARPPSAPHAAAPVFSTPRAPARSAPLVSTARAPAQDPAPAKPAPRPGEGTVGPALCVGAQCDGWVYRERWAYPASGYWYAGTGGDFVRTEPEPSEPAVPVSAAATPVISDPDAPDACTPDENAAPPAPQPEAALYRWVDADGTVNYADADDVPESVKRTAVLTSGDPINVQPALKCRKLAKANAPQ